MRRPLLGDDEIRSIELCLECRVELVPRRGGVAVIKGPRGVGPTLTVGISPVQISAARKVGVVRYVRWRLAAEADRRGATA